MHGGGLYGVKIHLNWHCLMTLHMIGSQEKGILKAISLGSLGTLENKFLESFIKYIKAAKKVGKLFFENSENKNKIAAFRKRDYVCS